MDQETIFVQTDPAFDVVLQSLLELNKQDRLQLTNFQTASLENIESSNGDGKFGGKRATLANSAFGRTASAIVRMCMLEAAGVPRRLWPKSSGGSDPRNRAKLVNQVMKPDHEQPVSFCLANNENAARFYWSKFDHIYPHFRIEHEVRQVTLNRQISMPSMMLIFRRSFTEVVKITTTFTATRKGEQQFESYIHVVCAVRKITAESSAEHPDGEYTKLLRKLMNPVQTSDAHFTKIKELKKGDDLNGLLDDLPTLNLKDENELLKNHGSLNLFALHIKTDDEC